MYLYVYVLEKYYDFCAPVELHPHNGRWTFVIHFRWHSQLTLLHTYPLMCIFVIFFLSAGPHMHRYYLCIHEKYVFAATFPTILYYMLPRNIFVQLRERSEIAQLFLGLAISFFIGTHVDPMTDTFSRGHIGVGLKYKFPNFYPHRKKNMYHI
jgi:hypothetical protein